MDFVASELLKIASLLAFVPDGDFRNKRDMYKTVRLLRMVLRRNLDAPAAASVVNNIGLISRGRMDVHKLNPVVLKEFDNFKGWGLGDFASLYSELVRHPVTAKVEDVIRRIENTPLAPADKREMLKHPQDLSLSESGRVYRRMDVNSEEQMFPGRRCRTEWKNHAKYRSELRGINPREMSHEVCEFIKKKHFGPKSQGELRPDNTRLKLPEGTAVVDYDPRKDPVPVDVITTWASVIDRVASSMLKGVV